MAPSLITNHQQQALARLIQQFKDKPLIEGLVSAFVEQTQADENVGWDMFVNRAVQTAEGAQLDVIGEIVGEDRRGRNDDDYRIGIITRIAINTSRGRASDAISIFAVLVGASDVQLLEYFPATVEIYCNVDFSGMNVPLLYETVDRVLSAGVRLFALGTFVDPGEGVPFGFEGDPSADGFGDTADATVGGMFTQIVSP